MATTVDDLIELKDEATDYAFAVVEGILAVFGETSEGVMGELLTRGRELTERTQLYDAAEESEATSIEDYEENYAEGSDG